MEILIGLVIFSIFIHFIFLITRNVRKTKLTELQAYVVAYYSSDEVIANAGKILLLLISEM